MILEASPEAVTAVSSRWLLGAIDALLLQAQRNEL